MVKLPRLKLNMTVCKAEGTSSLSRQCDTTAILAHLQVSINSLPSTIQSREVTLFPRRKEGWTRVCCRLCGWVQGEVRAVGCGVLAPAEGMRVSASWLGRIHSRSSLSPLMWPVSDFCLLSRQLAEMRSLFSLAAFFLADVLNFK